MHNVAEKLSFVELVERLARLRRFLLSEHKSGDAATRDVISVFHWAVQGILHSLDQIPARLVRCPAGRERQDFLRGKWPMPMPTSMRCTPA